MLARPEYVSLFSDHFLLETAKLTYKVVDWQREDLEGLGVSPWMIIYLQSKNSLFHGLRNVEQDKKLVHLSRQSRLEYQVQGVNYPRHGCAGHRLVLGSQFR